MADKKTASGFHWTRKFLRADALQPVRTMRMLLSEIRRNQWVLLEWDRQLQASRYYPLKKGELVDSLTGVSSETTVVQALQLDGKPFSQTVDSKNIQRIEGFADPKHPWLGRKVLLSQSGSPIAIGVPRTRREDLVRPEAISGAERERATAQDFQLASVIELEAQAEAPRGYSIVRVFYATDRARDSGGQGYSSNRDPDEKIRFGTCDVTIPRDHRMAELESPRWWKFEFNWNPEKHIMLEEIQELAEYDFMSLLRNYIDVAEDRSAFVFIHGYNVAFKDAARRTAQLSYDLGFKGAPIFYSWPSASLFSGYPADEATIEWTRPHLANFLSQIAQESKATILHVIAHSMGNRALVRILRELSLPAGSSPLFSQIVLTAPDIDAGEFLQLARSVQQAAARITLYASSNDKAIQASRAFHRYPRAGESGPDIVVVKGLDTVDASAVDTSFIGHSYFAEKRTVLSDLFYVFKDGKPPSERHGLESKMSSQGQYWAFKP